MEDLNKIKRNIPRPTFFGRTLRYLRKLSGLSQGELATQLNLKRNNIASYESNIVEPDANRFLVFCDYFSVAPVLMADELISESPHLLQLNPTHQENINENEVIELYDDLLTFTNEAEKIYEGYSIYSDMKINNENILQNEDMKTTLNEFLILLKRTIQTNQKFISGDFPADQLTK